MKFSVLIPAYNAAKTITETLTAVLAQTIKPFEILVLNDGSTDETADLVKSFSPNVMLIEQTNGGVAKARNTLCARAQGDVIAFLDADDVWHPRYLEAQQQQVEKYPHAAAYFTNHSDKLGLGPAVFRPVETQLLRTIDIIQANEFIPKYDMAPLQFQMSCCCVRKGILEALGPKPFCLEASTADDTYFHNSLPLHGPVAYINQSLVVYRITPQSLSADRLKMAMLVIKALQILEVQYACSCRADLYKQFRSMFASRKRNCGKFLMGSGQLSAARVHFKESFWDSVSVISKAKSALLLSKSYIPSSFGTKWPSSARGAAFQTRKDEY